MVHAQLNAAIIQNAIGKATCLFSLPDTYLHTLVADKNSGIDGFPKIGFANSNLTAEIFKKLPSAVLSLRKLNITHWKQPSCTWLTL
jgi:hypothetical protein